MKQISYYDYEMHKPKEIIFHGRKYVQPAALAWPSKCIAVLGEKEILKKHGLEFRKYAFKMSRAKTDTERQKIIAKCMQYAEANGLQCADLVMPDYEFCWWEPFYYNGCTAIAEKDKTKMSFVTEALDINGYTRLGELFRVLSKDLNAHHRFGETALTHAAQRGNRCMYLALLEAGADPNVCDRCGKTALWYAVRNKDGELIRHLIKHGALFSWEMP